MTNKLKVYTAFIDPNYPNLHVTHKYLGAQGQDDITEVRDLIENELLTQPELLLVVREMEFNTFKMFGPRNNIPVLTLEDHQGEYLKSFRETFLISLRYKLSKFQPKDDYAGFTPHVTIKDHPEIRSLVFRPTIFALMHKNNILMSWDI